MLSMLRVCRAIKYRSVRNVDAVHRLGAESTSCSLEHILFSAGGKLVSPTSTEMKEATDTEKVKQRRGETSHPRFRGLSPSSYRPSFDLSGRNKIEASAFEFTSSKHPDEGRAGNGKLCVACRCGTPAASSIAACHNQGLQSLVWQPL